MHLHNGCQQRRSFNGCDPQENLRSLRRQVFLNQAQINLNTARIAQLEQAVFPGPVPIDQIRQFFLNNVGQTVTFTTTIGTVTGTVQTVGTDAVVILEPTGNILIIPFRSVLAV
ncbi:hypothetical protein ACWE42_12550 [Sutcliffiella cohnii]